MVCVATPNAVVPLMAPNAVVPQVQEMPMAPSEELLEGLQIKCSAPARLLSEVTGAEDVVVL